MAPKTKRYEKKDPISHCLDRPDMYVGSVRLRNIMEFLFLDYSSWKIFHKEIINPKIAYICRSTVQCCR